MARMPYLGKIFTVYHVVQTSQLIPLSETAAQLITGITTITVVILTAT